MSAARPPSGPPDELPPPFADLREQFRAAAAREIEVERRVAERSRRGRRRVVVAVALGLLVPAAGVAGAARILSREDAEPVGGPDVSAAEPGIVPSTAVPDPDGGPPWALKVFTNGSGRDCVGLGRLSGGKLGRYSGGQFRPFPERMPGVCGDLAREPVMLVVNQVSEPQRTLIYGLSRDRAAITVDGTGPRRVVHPGALGTFLLVLEGDVPPQSITASWRERDRTVRRRVP